MRVQTRWALGLLSLVLAFPAWSEAGPVDGDQPAPIAYSYQPAPAAGSYPAAPVAGSYPAAPVAGSYPAAPVASGYPPAPVAGSYLPAPMAGSYPPAPVASGYQPAPVASGYQPAPLATGYAPAATANRYQPAFPSGFYQPGAMPASTNDVPPHKHKGLLGWRHCVECQRARAKRRDGVDVPPPPSLSPGLAMQGQVVAAPGTRCASCEAGAVSGAVVVADPHVPGYAVVGGPTVTQGDAPGYAVIGGNVAMAGAPGYAVSGGTGMEPSPIGVARSTQPQLGNAGMAAYGAGPGLGAYDPAVMPSSIPPPQNALASPAHDRPHIIRHLLGVPNFGERRRDREEKAREKHAAIAYDQPNAPVTELPASMVYGNKAR